MPGVFEVSRTVSIGFAIDEIMLIAEYSLEGEWESKFATYRSGRLYSGLRFQSRYDLPPVSIQRLLHRVVHEVDVELVYA